MYSIVQINANTAELALQKEALSKQQEKDNEITEKLEELRQLIEPLTV